MPTPLTIIFIGAHPDDEGSCGGCLARYAAEGIRAYVACATRGDGADAQIKDPTLATRETLGQVRSQELACACQRLGAQPPIFLGYQDGQVERAPLEAAALQVARLIREVRPTVVVTHGPEGGYGHPDHIAVSRFVTRGFSLAGDAAAGLDQPPFAPARLYYTAMPRSFLERVPAFRERRAQIGGQQLGFVGVEDERITTQVDIRAWLRVKQEALACHRTQFELDPETGQPKTFASSVPEPLRLEMFGRERFVLAHDSPRLDAGQAHPTNETETDLFHGLR